MNLNQTGVRIEQQLQFLREIDQMKHIYRQTLLLNGSRRENDAEHSWHVAMLATVLQEHASGTEVDLLRVIKMLLLHDIVEIDAGDTYVYDDRGYLDKEARERAAADRIYALLPDDQEVEFKGLWEEFEQRITPEARFAVALDRFQPLLFNYYTEGATWKTNHITRDQVIKRVKQPIQEGSESLWTYAEELINSAVKKGYLLA
ncbi:hydrolase [Brevibacillus halotolerans]|uniref:HD domain-containing protein n=1 Tax=Brevibacillus halotolerans TaxID=1507437 RepID=UPI001B294556|nr:HD domain-containing protein [Brevibacillus halotolerans]GIO02692.1 hydrolase [Brevibacillus halotolerans]